MIYLLSQRKENVDLLNYNGIQNKGGISLTMSDAIVGQKGFVSLAEGWTAVIFGKNDTTASFQLIFTVVDP